MVCADTARAVHHIHGLVEAVLPPDFLAARTGQDGAELGTRFGCTALPVEERTSCHAVRYAIGTNNAKSYAATTFALSRDLMLRRRLPTKDALDEDEIQLFASVLSEAGRENLGKKEQEFVDAAALRQGVAEAPAKAADVFEACKGMAMCDSGDESEGCGDALRSDLCLADPSCVMAVQACKPRCRHCAWVLRGWPAWLGECSAVAQGTATVGKSSATEAAAKADAPTAGLLSPPLAEALVSKAPTESALRQHCLSLAWAMGDLVDAERIVAGTGGDAGQQMRGPWPWSPVLACSCLGQCPYSSMDAFKLRDAGCIGPSGARETEAWARRHEEEPSSEGRAYRQELETEQLEAMASRWFPPTRFDELRRTAERVATQSKGLE